MVTRKDNPGYVRKIITAASEKDAAQLRQALAISGGKVVKELPLVQGFVCEFPAESEALIAVRDNPDSFTVEEDLNFKLCLWPGFFFYPPVPQQPPDQKEPLPPQVFPRQSVDWGIKRIGAPQVWNKLRERRIKVGIIDTGIDYFHPDLKENIRDGISTLDGYPSYRDDYGHGTHVAGTIGALNNPFGMVGINPYVDFYIVKAFDKKGNGKLSDIIEGMDWLMRRQVNVINMSFSTSETNQTFARVMDMAHNRGIVLVAAAGNDGGSDSVNYPARFPQVIAVSATDRQDNIAGFSSTGPEIDFCAPGVDIRSTWINGGYKVSSGTSFAAPHITGVVTDLLNYYGPMPPAQVKEMMARGTVILEKLNREQQGHGMIELPRIIK
ncbi:MAG: aerolysin [Peptococcaceae bacterium]|jgi:subtilisin|nr:aerolysin [Peptococcaceae bacterium]